MTTDGKVIGDLLCALGGRLVTAESCTGGGLAAKITAISGASAWYAGGWVTYSNAMKTSQLLVPEKYIKAHGAVSSQVAKSMCVGAIKQSGASYALSTTGIAGPSGGTEEKPTGTVYIACGTVDGIDVRHCLFSGTREQVQKQSIDAALRLLFEIIS
jgi:nicotinamide-nucleotide amidase